jgi:serine/threonine protein phosphatase PrpC
MNISISYYSEKGKRPKNEDAVSLLESSNGLLAIVADGLGGHDDGEIASQQAVNTMNLLLSPNQPDESKMIEAIQQASRDIFAQQKSTRNMLTTVAALWVSNTYAIAANVGDSRIYQFRNGKIIYQSLDHSVAQMAVLVGELDQSEIRTSKDRNRLVRVLGNEKAPKVDIKCLSVRQDDCFLLCSDGFWEAVTEEKMIETMLNANTADQWLSDMRRIVEKTNKPNQDNHTAIALTINKSP